MNCDGAALLHEDGWPKGLSKEGSIRGTEIPRVLHRRGRPSAAVLSLGIYTCLYDNPTCIMHSLESDTPHTCIATSADGQLVRTLGSTQNTVPQTG